MYLVNSRYLFIFPQGLLCFSLLAKVIPMFKLIFLVPLSILQLNHVLLNFVILLFHSLSYYSSVYVERLLIQHAFDQLETMVAYLFYVSWCWHTNICWDCIGTQDEFIWFTHYVLRSLKQVDIYSLLYISGVGI